MHFSDAFAFIALMVTSVAANPEPMPDFSDCTKLKVASLNAHSDKCKDERLNADCLSKFDATGLNHSCLDSLHENTLKSLPQKTCNEITKGNKEFIPKTNKFLHAFLQRNDFKQNAAPEVLKYIVSDTTFMEKLLKDSSFPKPLAARLFSEESMPEVQPAVCELFDKEMAETMNHKALTKIKSGCLSKIPEAFFKGLDEESFESIHAEALSAITKKQADAIPHSAVKKMTEAQAKNWGVEPKVPVVDANAADAAKQKEELKKYVAEHPCSSAKAWHANTPKATRVELGLRCKQVWAASSAYTISPVMGTTVGAIFIAAVAFML